MLWCCSIPDRVRWRSAGPRLAARADAPPCGPQPCCKARGWSINAVCLQYLYTVPVQSKHGDYVIRELRQLGCAAIICYSNPEADCSIYHIQMPPLVGQIAQSVTLIRSTTTTTQRAGFLAHAISNKNGNSKTLARSSHSWSTVK